MKKINIGEFCWWLLIGALSMVIGKLLIFDELRFYLHPKMTKFVIAAEIILLILFVYQQTKLFKRTENSFKIKIGYFLFLVPMFMLILAGDASAVIFENRTVNLNSLAQEQNAVLSAQKKKEAEKKAEEQKKTEEQAADSAVSSAYDALPAGEMNSPDPGATDPTDPKSADSAEPEIKTEDPFLQTLFSITEDEKSGQEIMLEGFVYKSEFFNQNEFMVSRMLVTCCAADATLIGVVAETPMANDFADNDWVRVKGVTKMGLVKNPMNGQEESKLILQVKEIEKMEPLETPYVYFSY